MWPENRRVATSDDRVSSGGPSGNPACEMVTKSPRLGRHRREHQRHAIDHQRFGDAMHEPLAQALQIEVAVQIAREADQRAAVVIAVAVVDLVEAGLDRVLHRARQQHDDQRRQQRDDRVLLLRVAQEDAAGDAQQHRVNRRDGRQRRRVDQRALDDDLDVHQAITDDGRRKRQRDEARASARSAESPRKPERERHRVAEHERQRCRARCPRRSSAAAGAR